MATKPSQRSHARFSFTQSNAASASVKSPSPPAKTRCVNSKRSPPWSDDSGGTNVPWEVGQSVTERAASFDVTSAPATKRRIVQHTVNMANRCRTGLYVDVIATCPRRELYIQLATVESRADGSPESIPTARKTRSFSAAINNGE